MRLDRPRTLAGKGTSRAPRPLTRGSPERPAREILKPEFLASLKRLDLRAKVLLSGFLQGLHKTGRKGFSAEFSGYRNFSPGDDPRWMDWRLYARTDRWYVKQFDAESSLRATLVVDASASMGYRSEATPFSKLEYGVTLAAGLAYLLQHQRDRAGLFISGGASAETSATFSEQNAFKKLWSRIKANPNKERLSEHEGLYLAPRSSRNHSLRILKELSALRAAGTANLATSIEMLALRERRKGLIAIFSDGLSPLEQLLEALKKLRQRGHDVLFFQIWDPTEVNPPDKPGVAFRDPETGMSYEPLPLREYQMRTTTHLEAIRRGAKSMGVEHQLLLTTTAYDRALLKFLALRKRRQ